MIKNILRILFLSLFVILLGFALVRHFNLLNDQIPVSGTGSMYPTFPKGKSITPQEQSKETVAKPEMLPYPNGITLFSKKYLNYEIKRTDIVAFENDKTKEISQKNYNESSGFIKRIIGLPGDKIEIKGGLIYVNDTPLNEPYIARARSTFGGEFLPECQVLTIPQNKLFVMGDNRKGSDDSRNDVGLIDYKDIDHVLSFEKQQGVFNQNWRDTSNDLKESSKIILDKGQFLSLLNQKRQENNVKPLKYDAKLEKSSLLRAQYIIKNNLTNDLLNTSTDNYPMEKSMDDAGYNNITFGEAPAFGYYEADELIDHFFAFPETKNFLLNKDFQDIGIALVEGNINGCPTQIIIQQFGGYLPPNYKKEDIDGWKKALENLKEIQPGWQSLKTDSSFYTNNKNDIDRINEIINIRITNISAIVNRMEANLWLSKSENDYSYKDKTFFEEQQSLAQKINNQKISL